MVAYEVSFEVEFSLHLRERNYVDLDDMFDDDENLESKVRSYGIQLKTKFEPSYRRDFLDIRRGKEHEASSNMQETLSMTEVTYPWINGLTKVEQGNFSHYSLGLTFRSKNHPIYNYLPFRRLSNYLQRKSRSE
jgi:hypothetical protein